MNSVQIRKVGGNPEVRKLTGLHLERHERIKAIMGQSRGRAE